MAEGGSDDSYSNSSCASDTEEEEPEWNGFDPDATNKPMSSDEEEEEEVKSDGDEGKKIEESGVPDSFLDGC